MDEATSELPESLYEHWQNLKLVEYVPESAFRMMSDHPIRDAFVQILRKGLDDNGRKRHSLSLKELLPRINEFLGRKSKGEQVKLTALYHHRDQLIEEGLIEEVDVVLEGKRYVSYYGRTAKGFILGEDSEEIRKEKKETAISMMKTVLNDLNPDLDESEMTTFLQNYYDQIAAHFDLMEVWISENEEVIQNTDIDIIEFVAFVKGLLIAHPSIVHQTQKLGELLKLPGF